MGRELENMDKEITKATLCMVNPYEAFIREGKSRKGLSRGDLT